jgi:hypothetical protein
MLARQTGLTRRMALSRCSRRGESRKGASGSLVVIEFEAARADGEARRGYSGLQKGSIQTVKQWEQV